MTAEAVAVAALAQCAAVLYPAPRGRPVGEARDRWEAAHRRATAAWRFHIVELTADSQRLWEAAKAELAAAWDQMVAG